VHTRAYIMTFTWLGALRPLSGPRSWVLGRYLNAGIFTPVHDMVTPINVRICVVAITTHRIYGVTTL
jgi:hypothetical protein